MTEAFEPVKYSLRLYVNGASATSLHAIETMERLRAEDVGGELLVEIIDVNDAPALVVLDHVFAVPTLLRQLPPPVRRLIGDISDVGRVRVALELGAPAASDDHTT